MLIIEIDECAEGTDNCDDNNATCDNVPAGSFTCTCNEGYSGDGVICEGVYTESLYALNHK